MVQRIILTLLLLMGVPLWATYLCHYEQYHFTATDEHGNEIDSWDVGYLTCWDVGPMGPGGSGDPLPQDPVPDPADCKRKTGFCRMKEQGRTTEPGDWATLRVSSDFNGNGQVGLDEVVNLTELGVSYAAYTEMVRNRGRVAARVAAGSLLGGGAGGRFKSQRLD